MTSRGVKRNKHLLLQCAAKTDLNCWAMDTEPSGNFLLVKLQGSSLFTVYSVFCLMGVRVGSRPVRNAELIEPMVGRTDGCMVGSFTFFH